MFGSNNLTPPAYLQPQAQRESFKMAAIIAESRLLAQRFMHSKQAKDVQSKGLLRPEYNTAFIGDAKLIRR